MSLPIIQRFSSGSKMIRKGRPVTPTPQIHKPAVAFPHGDRPCALFSDKRPAVSVLYCGRCSAARRIFSDNIFRRSTYFVRMFRILKKKKSPQTEHNKCYDFAIAEDGRRVRIASTWPVTYYYYYYNCRVARFVRSITLSVNTLVHHSIVVRYARKS